MGGNALETVARNSVDVYRATSLSALAADVTDFASKLDRASRGLEAIDKTTLAKARGMRAALVEGTMTATREDVFAAVATFITGYPNANTRNLESFTRLVCETLYGLKLSRLSLDWTMRYLWNRHPDFMPSIGRITEAAREAPKFTYLFAKFDALEQL